MLILWICKSHIAKCIIIIQALKAGAIPGIDQDPDAAAEQFAPNNFIRVTRYDVFMSPETRRKDVGDQVGNIYLFNDRMICFMSYITFIT